MCLARSAGGGFWRPPDSIGDATCRHASPLEGPSRFAAGGDRLFGGGAASDGLELSRLGGRSQDQCGLALGVSTVPGAHAQFRTIRDREALLKPQTLRLIQAKVVQLGQAAGITTGSRLRVDSSVIESNIHYPTESSLLNDAARVLGRPVYQARDLVRPNTPAQRVRRSGAGRLRVEKSRLAS
jgi:hypothetical protein